MHYDIVQTSCKHKWNQSIISGELLFSISEYSLSINISAAFHSDRDIKIDHISFALFWIRNFE